MGLNKSSMVTQLLQELLTTADAMVSVPAYQGRSYEDILRFRKAKENQRRYQALQYLKRRKLIDIRRTEKGMMVALTGAGKSKAIREVLQTQTKKLPKGATCIVVFDIPEKARQARQNFRYFLKRCGFKLIQLSVWESDHDFFLYLKIFIKKAKIGKWVTVLEAHRKS